MKEMLLMNFELDEIDRGILRKLQQNGRVPLSEIARELHLSRTAIRYRIEEMESCDIIHGYTVLLNPLMFETAVYVRILIEAKPSNVSECIKVLMYYDEICELVRLSGPSPLFATAYFLNSQYLNDFVISKLENLPIESYNLQPIIQVMKRTRIPI
ncbi:MAG: Lrp/AsnC family transcriptional regulator [Thermoplasmata archaeon]|nr:Lrp/AsnC family transcriptional regulator [Thermoplasmata archaeon]